MQYELSLIIWLPIVMGVLIACLKNHVFIAKILSLCTIVIAIFLAFHIFIKFDSAMQVLQFTEKLKWIPSLNIYYALGVDGISVPLLLLNNFITLLVIILSLQQPIKEKVAFYHAMFLIMTGLISGVFCATDAILFYIFFEAMLIPMYLIIGIWGSSNRVYAAIKFFLYTLLGSLLMLIALIYLYFKTQRSFDIFAYYHTQLSLTAQTLVLIAFFFAFAVKVPMWPVHTWLPDAHPEAPTGGSMVLAAVTLKIGGYGFFRFILTIVPDAFKTYAFIFIGLSLIAIVYIGLVAIVQQDMKKLVAYSSIAHMGFVTLGTAMFINGNLNVLAMQGAMIQMISHGFVSAAMFMCIGVMYDRIHSRQIKDYQGVAKKMPIFAAFFMLFAMANGGLPGTSGFVGEFLVIMGAIQVNLIYGFFAGLTLIIGAGYTLWMYKRTIFGEIVNPEIHQMSDVNLSELSVLIILAGAVLFMGLYPEYFVHKMQIGIDNVMFYASQSKLAQ